ncbi:MAG: hypothetical protein WC471_02095 [Candidatus Woesearchaeota archaeon]
MQKEGIMETDVDSLLALLNERKSISVPEAAKLLGVTPEVVEEWARFFEEEGLLGIRYDFTTPFIELKEGGKLEPGAKPKEKKFGFGDVIKEFMPAEKTKAALPPVSARQTGNLNVSSPLSAQPQVADVSKLMNQAQKSVLEGDFLEAKEMYRKLYDAFNRLPGAFLEKYQNIEDDLVKLNNEIVVRLENKLQDDMRLKHAEILKLLKEAQSQLKNKDFDNASSIYSQIKIIYKQLPPGFFHEKNEITKRVLEFYENLNSLRGKLANNLLKDKTKIIENQLLIAKAALKAEKVDEASIAYSTAREAYTALPDGFFEEKIALQQKLLEVHQQIMDTKKKVSVGAANSKLIEIQNLLGEIKTHIKQKDIVTSVQKYAEIKTLYSQMPKGFIKNEHDLQNDILKTYKEISTTKNNIAMDAINDGRIKIEHFLKKGKSFVTKNDFDMGFQYYKQSVETYNLMPKGFDKTKVEVRNRIYDGYFEMVSHSDAIVLGELQGYAREKYFTLLKMIVDAYEAVDSGRFQLLPDMYKGLYLLYQELPLSIVSKNLKLKDGIKNVYLMYKIYSLLESLKSSEELRDYAAIQDTLTELSGMIEQVITEVPNADPLVNYARNKLTGYRNKMDGIKREPSLELPAPSTKGDKQKVDELLNKAMNYLTLKNQAKALALINEVLKIDPENGAAKAMMDEVNLETIGKSLISPSEVNEKINSALIKLDEFNYEEAIKLAEEALDLDPENEDAYLIMQKAKAALR